MKKVFIISALALMMIGSMSKNISAQAKKITKEETISWLSGKLNDYHFWRYWDNFNIEKCNEHEIVAELNSDVEHREYKLLYFTGIDTEGNFLTSKDAPQRFLTKDVDPKMIKRIEKAIFYLQSFRTEEKPVLYDSKGNATGTEPF